MITIPERLQAAIARDQAEVFIRIFLEAAGDSSNVLYITPRKVNEPCLVFLDPPEVRQALDLKSFLPAGSGFSVVVVFDRESLDTLMTASARLLPGRVAELCLRVCGSDTLDPDSEDACRLGYFVLDNISYTNETMTLTFTESTLFNRVADTGGLARPPFLYSLHKGTLHEAMIASATTCKVSLTTPYDVWSGDGIHHNIGLKIEDEIMAATTATMSSGVLVVDDIQRGILGTTAADHDAGKEVVIFPIWYEMGIGNTLRALLSAVSYSDNRASFSLAIDDNEFTQLDTDIYQKEPSEYYVHITPFFFDEAWRTADGTEILQMLTTPYLVYLRNQGRIGCGFVQPLRESEFLETDTTPIAAEVRSEHLIGGVKVDAFPDILLYKIERHAVKNVLTGEYDPNYENTWLITVGAILSENTLTLNQDFVRDTSYAYEINKRFNHFFDEVVAITLTLPLPSFMHIVPGDYIRLSSVAVSPLIGVFDDIAFVLQTTKNFTTRTMEVKLLYWGWTPQEGLLPKGAGALDALVSL